MTPVAHGGTPRAPVRITLGVMLASCFLASSALAHADSLSNPLPAPDPDTARGLDDPRWSPKAGSVRVATLPSGLGDLPVDTPGSVTAQAADDSFQWQGRTAHLFTYCVTPSKEDARYADVRACFKARRFEDEADAAGNQYVGEGFNVFAYGKDGWRIDRVKGRVEQRSGEAVDWSPGSDEEHGKPSTVSVNAGWKGSSLSASWNLYPGRVHPWVGRNLSHSSWITQSRGAPSRDAVQAMGAAIWQFQPGDSIGRTGIGEVWLSR